MIAALNILKLLAWVLATYAVWFIMEKATDLSESQGDSNGKDLDTQD